MWLKHYVACKHQILPRFRACFEIYTPLWMSLNCWTQITVDMLCGHIRINWSSAVSSNHGNHVKHSRIPSDFRFRLFSTSFCYSYIGVLQNHYHYPCGLRTVSVRNCGHTTTAQRHSAFTQWLPELMLKIMLRSHCLVKNEPLHFFGCALGITWLTPDTLQNMPVLGRALSSSIWIRFGLKVNMNLPNQGLLHECDMIPSWLASLQTGNVLWNSPPLGFATLAACTVVLQCAWHFLCQRSDSQDYS